MKRNRGMGMLEVAFGIVIVGGLTVLSGYALLHQFRAQSKTESRLTGSTEFASMLRHILQIGRLSHACQKVVEGSSPKILSLACQVDYGSPPMGTLSEVRFRWQQPEEFLRFQTKTAGAWTDTIRYGDSKAPITDFEVCDTSEMNSVNPSCTLQPVELSRLAGKNLLAMQGRAPSEDYSNRFFRFAVTSGGEAGVAPWVLQSSFFVRNPTGVGGLSYQWGILK